MRIYCKYYTKVLLDYTESETGFRIWTVCLHTVWAKPNLDLRIRETASWTEQIQQIQDGVSWGEMYVYNTINTVYYALVVKSLEVDKKKSFPG